MRNRCPVIFPTIHLYKKLPIYRPSGRYVNYLVVVEQQHEYPSGGPNNKLGAWGWGEVTQQQNIFLNELSMRIKLSRTLQTRTWSNCHSEGRGSRPENILPLL
jgi:hypothetical protein